MFCTVPSWYKCKHSHDHLCCGLEVPLSGGKWIQLLQRATSVLRFLIFFPSSSEKQNQNKPWANVADHTFLLKVAADTLRSRKELEMSTDWLEEPREKGWDCECPHRVTMTELRLSSSYAAGHSDCRRESESVTGWKGVTLSVSLCYSIDPCLQSLTHPRYLQTAELVALIIDAEIPCTAG